MSKEYWATYSVKDHCAENAFVADLMLYDRMVVPVPPDDAETARWERNGWEPKRLEHLLKIIGDDRVKTVPWTDWRQRQWRDRYDAAKSAQRDTRDLAFQATRMELTLGLPAHVTAVEALSAYQKVEDLEKGVGIRSNTGEKIQLPQGAVTAILGHEFLVPDAQGGTHDELLRDAVSFSSDREFRRKRANLWRWQFDFVNPRTSLTDAAAIKAAVEEMQDLVSEEQAVVRKARITTASRYAFLVGTVTIGMFTAGMLPVALSPMAAFLSESFLSVGQFMAERLLEPKTEEDPLRPAAILTDAQRHFGWSKRQLQDQQ